MKTFLKTKDFSVTGEAFDLVFDETSQMLLTRPKPDNLEPYYQSPNYISHTDSNNSFSDKIYQIVKSFNLWMKINVIKKYAKGDKSLLDVGAGTGDFLVSAKNTGWSVEGIEPNLVARMRSREKGMELHPAMDDLPEKKFQIITLWHVLEHLPDLEKQILKFHSSLKFNGTLIVAVPNYRSYDAEHYKEYWAAYDVPRHLWHFSRASMDIIFEKYGFKVIKTKPMFFDAFYVSLLSEKYKTNNSNFINAFLIGLFSNLKGLVTKEHSSIIYILKIK